MVADADFGCKRVGGWVGLVLPAAAGVSILVRVRSLFVVSDAPSRELVLVLLLHTASLLPIHALRTPWWQVGSSIVWRLLKRCVRRKAHMAFAHWQVISISATEFVRAFEIVILRNRESVRARGSIVYRKRMLRLLSHISF
jgi:hypothetical protein